MSASFPYVYNDIDDTMANYRQMAMQYGWQVVYPGKNPLAEPSFFPAIEPDKIMAMARLAARFNCNQSCSDLCYQPHPLLRIGEFAYCKLCTRIWNNLVSKTRRSK